MPHVERVEADAIEVIYEKGVLRPVHPLDFAEGTRLEVTMKTVIDSATPATATTKHEEAGETGVPVQVDEATYEAFLSELDNIAALPLESAPQAHTVRDHDAILYPKQGTMP